MVGEDLGADGVVLVASHSMAIVFEAPTQRSMAMDWPIANAIALLVAVVLMSCRVDDLTARSTPPGLVITASSGRS